MKVMTYVDTQFDMFLQEETRVPRMKLADTRVHACLYFISPNGHGLKNIDIECMKRLHRKVNIIPVIGENKNIFKYFIKIFCQVNPMPALRRSCWVSSRESDNSFWIMTSTCTSSLEMMRRETPTDFPSQLLVAMLWLMMTDLAENSEAGNIPGVASTLRTRCGWN